MRSKVYFLAVFLIFNFFLAKGQNSVGIRIVNPNQNPVLELVSTGYIISIGQTDLSEMTLGSVRSEQRSFKRESNLSGNQLPNGTYFLIN